MSEMPGGTVTFLFTDIEGSTRLLALLKRDRYGELLEDHHRLIRAAFEPVGGQEEGTQGDSFFVTFRRAKDAILAAVAAQRSLAEHTWPDGLEVRVRMGLHTGEPSLSQAGMVSMAVHRAARISAAGHGGQVLLSGTTRDLVEDELPHGVTIRDLGEHRLKDLDRPERISQLVIEGLPSEFPPLKTLGSQTDVALPAPVARHPVARLSRLARRRPLLLAAIAAVVAAAVLAGATLGLGRGSGASFELVGNAVGVIDPDGNRLVGEVPVGARPADVVYGAGSVWVANLGDQTISRIDPATERVERTISTEVAPTGLAASGNAIWFASTRSGSDAVSVRRISARFEIVDKDVAVRGNSFSTPTGGWIAGDARALWVVPQGLGAVSRIDPRSGDVVAEIDAASLPTSVAVGAGSAWVADGFANKVSRIDLSNVVAATIPVGRSPTAVAVGAGGVWVTASQDDAVYRIDPATNAVRSTIRVGRAPTGVTVGAGSVWVANSRDGTISRIDPSRDEVVATIRVGGTPQDVAFGRDRIWVTVQKATPAVSEAMRAGGAARLNAESVVESLDPALATSPLATKILYATCAKLLNYPDRPAPAGSRLVPELAQSMPARSADGRTYTFTIRDGFRFSPPSTETVTAETMKYAIERTLSPRMRSPARELGVGIVGARAFAEGRAEHVAGVVARGRTLTIRLAEPLPDFATRIADQAFCAVPRDTPIDPRGVQPPASAGPYYVASHTPGQEVVLRRNPRYGGSRPHRLAELSLRLGISRAETVKAVEAGEADYAADEVPGAAHARLAARYGPGSAAARAGRQQYFVNSALQVAVLQLNESRPLFADVRVRRAVNLAIDRRVLARQVGPAAEFESVPTDQYLPPGLPGFSDRDVYPFTPDVAAARKLMGGRRRTATFYTCDVAPCPQIADLVADELRPIGIDVEVESFPLGPYVERLYTPGEPYDLALGLYGADSPDPGRFFAGLFSEKAAYGGASSVDRPPFRDRLAAAGRLYGTARDQAFGELDAELARDAAPLAAFGADTKHDFFSRRMGCQVYQPLYGISLAALCFRG